MRGVVMHAPGDVRVEQIPDPQISAPTDAILRTAAVCICGSDRIPRDGRAAGYEGPARGLAPRPEAVISVSRADLGSAPPQRGATPTTSGRHT